MTTDNTIRPPHHGKNIKRIRELKGMKQDALAAAITEKTKEKWDQSRVSYLEGREEIEDKLLIEVAEILGVPSEAIKSWPESQLPMVLFSPTFTGNSSPFSWFTTYNVNSKVIELFERLLTSEQQKVEMLLNNQEALKKEIEVLKAQVENLPKKNKS